VLRNGFRAIPRLLSSGRKSVAELASEFRILRNRS
jgi:hypothetical protein